MSAGDSHAASFADGVNFVNENDRPLGLVRLFKQTAHAAGAHAHEKLNKLRSRNGEERHIAFAGDRFGQQSFAGAGKPHQQDAAGNLGAHFQIFFRIFQKINDFRQFFFGLF